MSKRDEFGNVVEDTLPTAEEAVAISAENVANAEGASVEEVPSEEVVENN